MKAQRQDKLKWTMPEWMKSYLPFILGNKDMRKQKAKDIEILQNGTADVFSNAVLALTEIGVNAQIGLLTRLHNAGKINVPLTREEEE